LELYLCSGYKLSEKNTNKEYKRKTILKETATKQTYILTHNGRDKTNIVDIHSPSPFNYYLWWHLAANLGTHSPVTTENVIKRTDEVQ